VALGALTGCVANGVRPFNGTVSDIRSDNAIVVVGVTVDGAWPHPQFGVVLDQYDVKAQAITGDCFGYNRVEAVVPATPAPTRFLAFDVPSGHYAYSAFNGGAFVGRDQAFQALPGHAVYIGDFRLGDNGAVSLRDDLAESRSAIARALPHVPPGLEAAPTVTVAPARPFMCSP
jgi:hypothetical protein